MKKPTPADIKHSEALGEHFFDRATLRFFGQRMADFRTEWHDQSAGIVCIHAPMRMDGRAVGETVRYVDVSAPDWREVRKGDLQPA